MLMLAWALASVLHSCSARLMIIFCFLSCVSFPADYSLFLFSGFPDCAESYYARAVIRLWSVYLFLVPGAHFSTDTSSSGSAFVLHSSVSVPVCCLLLSSISLWERSEAVLMFCCRVRLIPALTHTRKTLQWSYTKYQHSSNTVWPIRSGDQN